MLALGKKQTNRKVGFVVFANFHSVNTLTRSDFKVPACHHSSGIEKGCVQSAPACWFKLALEPLGEREASTESRRKRRISLGREGVGAGDDIPGGEKSKS